MIGFLSVFTWINTSVNIAFFDTYNTHKQLRPVVIHKTKMVFYCQQLELHKSISIFACSLECGVSLNTNTPCSFVQLLHGHKLKMIISNRLCLLSYHNDRCVSLSVWDQGVAHHANWTPSLSLRGPKMVSSSWVWLKTSNRCLRQTTDDCQRCYVLAHRHPTGTFHTGLI